MLAGDEHSRRHRLPRHRAGRDRPGRRARRRRTGRLGRGLISSQGFDEPALPARIEHPPSVVLVVSDEDQLVLVRQHRPGADGPVVELPAGKLEPGETPLAAAVRELAEECGLAAAGWRTLGSFWAAPAYSTERVTVLAGTVDGPASATADGDEQIEVLRVPAVEAFRYLEEATSLAALTLHREELVA